MRIVIRDLRLNALASDNDAEAAAKKQLNSVFGANGFRNVSVYRSSVDARHVNNITKVFSVCADIECNGISDDVLKKLNATVLENGALDVKYGNEKAEYRPLIVGFGPAGMFCGLVLAENGYRPIIIERGNDISERDRAVMLFRTKGILDTESNVQFGAGGAGTFSDGKLVTRINDKNCRYVIESFHKFGAPDSILTNAKPHIGTDNLGRIVSAIKERITECGGEVFFNTRFEGYKKIGGGLSVKTSKGDLSCSTLVLATGHSARDTYTNLAEAGLEMVSKAFSVGVRVEQLQAEINRSVYGRYAKMLGNAEYNFSYRKGERAVYTFCMCPGGHVVEAASEEETVVVNGMSNYKRDGENSNAALVVSVLPEDCGGALFDGMNFQRQLERKAFVMGGSDYGAPIQTVGDYLNGTSGSAPTRIKPSYMDGKRNRLCDLNGLFPGYINSFLKEGLCRFEKKIKGYAPADAIMTGVETRTSSPIRIVRNEMLLSPTLDRIYPCGEGAGYAGGITSASVDGIRVALKIMERYKPLV
ncbi:MAG: hypothetical protein E7615_01715 [Ruminococcaceae bacterium]|nr:hypothetical protein [Oscillospiraceae bacterium]